MFISFAKFTRQESADYTALMALTKIKRCKISVGQKNTTTTTTSKNKNTFASYYIYSILFIFFYF